MNYLKFTDAFHVIMCQDHDVKRVIVCETVEWKIDFEEGTSGELQGSVLAAIVFKTYINEMPIC